MPYLSLLSSRHGPVAAPHSLFFSTTAAARLGSSSSSGSSSGNDKNDPAPRLTHVSDSGSAHMVSISDKQPTKRTATARCTVRFSHPAVLGLVRANEMKKGDVLGVARVAGIMAAKRTPDLIPLCHPVAVSHVRVDLTLGGPDDGNGTDTDRGTGAAAAAAGSIEIAATVSCDGKTGVEMEALTAASTAALTVYDMCKAVDKHMVIDGLRVVLKEGGRSGRWVEGVQEEDATADGSG